MRAEEDAFVQQDPVVGIGVVGVVGHRRDRLGDYVSVDVADDDVVWVPATFSAPAASS